MTASTGPLGEREVEAVARRVHAADRDKAGRPYAEHLEAVASGVRAAGGSEAQLCAAWLHDAVEDGRLPAAWLHTAPLPPGTAALVLALTRVPGEEPVEYAARILATEGALLIKEADLAHNADPVRLAALDPATSRRLTGKYARLRELLGLTAG